MNLVLDPLVSLVREGYEEVAVRGQLIICDARGIRWHSGPVPARGLLPARSLLKPLQFLGTGLAHPASPLGPFQVAALGSVSATEAQVRQLKAWYASGPEHEAMGDVLVKPVLPMYEEHRASLQKRGGSPCKLFHPCFSKHMAILRACRQRAWPVRGYTELEHPFHLEVLRVLEQYIGAPAREIAFVTDGCGLPTPALSAHEMAHAFMRLAGADEGSEAGRIAAGMWTHPEWVGGPERLDTALMQANPGRVIAKEGADGLLAVGVRPSGASSSGMGILLKLAGGPSRRFSTLVLNPFLHHLGLEVPAVEAIDGQSVECHVGP